MTTREEALKACLDIENDALKYIDPDQWVLGKIETIRAFIMADQWLPISSAPCNELVLLYCPDTGCVSNPERIELDCASHGWRNEVASNMSFHSWATHWRPLPPPPKEQE